MLETAKHWALVWVKSPRPRLSIWQMARVTRAMLKRKGEKMADRMIQKNQGDARHDKKQSARRFIELAFVLLTVGLLSACATPSGSSKPLRVSTSARPAAALSAPSQITPLAQKILKRINKARGSSLSVSAILQKAAAGHAADMAARNYFSHINPEGQAPRERLLALDGSFRSVVAENIATSTFLPGTTMREKADKFVHVWMNSPHHRRNIRNTRFTKTGLGIAQRGDEIYAVHLFSE